MLSNGWYHWEISAGMSSIMPTESSRQLAAGMSRDLDNAGIYVSSASACAGQWPITTDLLELFDVEDQLQSMVDAMRFAAEYCDAKPHGNCNVARRLDYYLALSRRK
jgi:hypothetical protein